MDLSLNTRTPNFDSSGSAQANQAAGTGGTQTVNTPNIKWAPVDNMTQADQTQGEEPATYNASTQNPQLPKPVERTQANTQTTNYSNSNTGTNTTPQGSTGTTANTGTQNTGTQSNTGTTTNLGAQANAGTQTNTGAQSNVGTQTNAGTTQSNVGTQTNTGTQGNTGTQTNAGTQSNVGTGANAEASTNVETQTNTGTTQANVRTQNNAETTTETPANPEAPANAEAPATTETPAKTETQAKGEAQTTATPPKTETKAETPTEEKKTGEDKKEAKHAGTTQGTLADQSVDQPKVQDQEGNGKNKGGQDGGGSDGGQGGQDGGGKGSSQGDSSGSNSGQQQNSQETEVVGITARSAVNLSAAPNNVEGASDSPNATPQVNGASQTTSAGALTEIAGTDKMQNIINVFYDPPVNGRQLAQNLVNISDQITKIANSMAASMADGPDKFRYTDFLTKVGDALRKVQSLLQEMVTADSAMDTKLSKAQLDMHLNQIEHRRAEMDKQFQKQNEALAKQATMGILSKIFAFLIPLLIIILAPIMIPILVMAVMSSAIWSPLVASAVAVSTALVAAEFIDCCAAVAGKPSFAMQMLMDAIKTVISAVFLSGVSAAERERISEIMKFILLAACLVFMVVVAFPQMLLGGIMLITDMMGKMHLFGNLVKACGGSEAQAAEADTYAGLAVTAIFAIAAIITMFLPIPGSGGATIGALVSEFVSVAVKFVVTVLKFIGTAFVNFFVTAFTFAFKMPKLMASVMAFLAANGSEIVLQSAAKGSQSAATIGGAGTKGIGSGSGTVIAQTAAQGGKGGALAEGAGQTALEAAGKVLSQGAQYMVDKLKSILRQLLDPEFLFSFGLDATTVAVDAVTTAQEWKLYKLKGELAILQAQIDAEFQLTEAHIKILKKVIQDLLDSMAGFMKELSQVAALNKKIISGQSQVATNLFSVSSTPS